MAVILNFHKSRLFERYVIKLLFFHRSVCLSVSVSVRLPPEEFACNLILGTSAKIYRENTSLVKIGPKCQVLFKKAEVCVTGTGDIKYEAQTALVKDPVRTALLTLYISVIKTNQFML